MKNFILLFFAIFSTPILQAQIDTVLAGQLQSIIDQSVNNSGNNGVSAHLITPDGTTWDGLAGVGKNNLPITTTTLFHGASTTKLNIAILIMLLAEENLIDLDASWKNYVNINANFDPLITVRQLLNHTSGITDYLETAQTGNAITSNFDYFFSPQYILDSVVSEIPDFPVGTNFQYSNSNYVLAALIAETVTGNPVHVELRNRIWNPLGMSHTYFGGYENYTEPTAGVWWNFGNGLTNYNNMPTTSMLSYAYGAGNIVTCPTDLAILLSGLLDGQLLSTSSLEEMMHFVPESFNSWSAGYGLGIHHASVSASDQVVGHDGYYTNLTSMYHSTTYGFTLVTMTNTQTQWSGIFNPMYEILANYFSLINTTDFENLSNLTIYPNPTNGQFQLSCSQDIDKIIIKDIQGKTIQQLKTNSQKIHFQIDRQGLYFVTIVIDQQAITKKLIVRNE